MNFSCNKCQRRYSIADDKVRGKTVKVRCKNCQNVISVEGPPAETEESTRVVSLADVERLREQDRSLAEEESAAAVAQPAPAAAAANMSWEDEPTRTMPLRDASSPWFVMVKSKQEGPLDEGALSELVASGAVTARSYFWQQGMPDWKRGQDIPELAGFFAPAAPPPAPPPPPARAAPPPPLMAPEPDPFPVEQSATSWQPDPPAPSQTTWETEPAPRRAASARQDSTPWEQDPDAAVAAGPDTGSVGSDMNGAPLGELFSDLDLPQSEQGDGGELGMDSLAGSSREDPLAALGKEPEQPRKPAENTQYFVKKAGMHRRNPAWKIALFVVLLVALPVGVLYALTEMQVVPLRVTRVDAKGQVVQQPVSVFSPEGIGELRDLMLGRTKPPPPAPPPAPKTEAKTEKKVEAKPAPTEEAAKPVEQDPAAQPPQGEEQKAVAALYGEGEKKDVGPEVRENTEVAPTDSAAQSGPPPEALDRVVKQSQTAFKSCIEQALRKNPKLRDGKLLLTATVGSTGTVKKVSFDRDDVNGSPMGNCIKARARRMVFPSFEGDDVEVEIPLVLSKSM
ncbi:AgmX/PglI C-terminal domain-containing protein [Archangium violaceum]|uniref:AgmX/PglI C-terminal domain-containing protein n=1 Tax=Archangium violaceum TaxID=83451 RepID=UPI002B29347D|nr:AgmX/PglI C-terminal domain-containing protein [Archangium gephyra]